MFMFRFLAFSLLLAQSRCLECNICGEGNKMMEPKGIVSLVTSDGVTRKQNCDLWQKNNLLEESFCESGEILAYTRDPCKCMDGNGTLLIDLIPDDEHLNVTAANETEATPDPELYYNQTKKLPGVEEDDGDDDLDEAVDSLGENVTISDEDTSEKEGDTVLDTLWQDAEDFAKTDAGKQALKIIVLIAGVGALICFLGCCFRRCCRRNKDGTDIHGLTLNPEFTDPAVFT